MYMTFKEFLMENKYDEIAYDDSPETPGLKRREQRRGRNWRSKEGKGKGGGNYVDRLFNKDRPQHYEDETETKIPATRDILKTALNRPKETTREMQPSGKRWDQRSRRRGRSIGRTYDNKGLPEN